MEAWKNSNQTKNIVEQLKKETSKIWKKQEQKVERNYDNKKKEMTILILSKYRRRTQYELKDYDSNYYLSYEQTNEDYINEINNESQEED